MASMIELTTHAELDAALARSAERPVLIFKHSPTCGTSAQAHEEIETLLADNDIGADVYVISVVRRRPVSNAVAERFGIRHESPQVLLIDGGAVRWQASHFRVTADRIEAALRSIQPVPSASPELG